MFRRGLTTMSSAHSRPKESNSFDQPCLAKTGKFLVGVNSVSGKVKFRPPSSEPGSSKALFWVAVSIVSAAAGYLLHHSGYFAEHRLQEAILAVALASVIGVVVVAVVANRRHPSPPEVVLSRGSVEVVVAEPGSLSTLTSIHARYLSSGLFVSLGPAFMRAYYAGFIRSPFGLAYVAEAKGHPAGMLVGTTNQRRHLRWVLKNQSLRLAVLAISALATRPVTTFRFLRTRVSRYRTALSKRNEPESTAAETRIAVLSHVAVVLGARGEGVGKQLVSMFEEQAKDAGSEKAHLVTSEGEAGAREFYSGLGWHVTGTSESLDGETTISMGKDLT